MSVVTVDDLYWGVRPALDPGFDSEAADAAFARLSAEAGNPSVGRIVHYHSRGSADGKFKPEARAAIITAVGGLTRAGTGPWSLTVSVAVLNPTGMFFQESVPHSPTPKPGHWSWPPRI